MINERGNVDLVTLCSVKSSIMSLVYVEQCRLRGPAAQPQITRPRQVRVAKHIIECATNADDQKCDSVDGRTKEETSRVRGKSDGETREMIKGMIVW